MVLLGPTNTFSFSYFDLSLMTILDLCCINRISLWNDIADKFIFGILPLNLVWKRSKCKVVEFEVIPNKADIWQHFRLTK